MGVVKHNLGILVSIVTMGHETVMAKTTFFGSSEGLSDDNKSFDFTREYPYQEQLVDVGNELSKVINQCRTHLLLVCHLAGNFQQGYQFASHFQW